MNFIKKIILILFILVCPLSAFADNLTSEDFKNNCYISAVKNPEKDYIKNDFRQIYLNLAQNSRNSFHKSSKNNLQGSRNEFALISNLNNELNNKYVDFEEFKDNSSYDLISFLKFQIQPNAP